MTFAKGSVDFEFKEKDGFIEIESTKGSHIKSFLQRIDCKLSIGV